MPVAYIYRGTFQVRSGETLRYREIAPDGVIAPEVSKTYAELAGIGSLSVPAVSLTPLVAVPSLSGVQIGAMAGAPVSLQPVVSPAAVSGVQVGSIGASTVSLRPTVAVGSLTGVEVANSPTQPVITATGGDTTVTIAKTSGGTGATSYDIKWGTSAGSRTNTISGVTLPYTHTGRTNGTTYYYSLVAVNGSGSTESAEVSASAEVFVPVVVTETFSAALDPAKWATITGLGAPVISGGLVAVSANRGARRLESFGSSQFAKAYLPSEGWSSTDGGVGPAVYIDDDSTTLYYCTKKSVWEYNEATEQDEIVDVRLVLNKVVSGTPATLGDVSVVDQLGYWLVIKAAGGVVKAFICDTENGTFVEKISVNDTSIPYTSTSSVGFYQGAGGGQMGNWSGGDY